MALTLHSRSRLPVRSALRRVVRAVGAAVLTCAPLGLGVWRVGSPWASPALTALFGPVPGLAIPLLVLAQWDERTPRVAPPFASRARTAG